MSYPSAMLLGHLQILGPWCPGHRCGGHHSAVLTARTGRVLCRECTDTVESERRAAERVLAGAGGAAGA